MLRPVSLSRSNGKNVGYWFLSAVLLAGAIGDSPVVARTPIPAEVRTAPDFSRVDLNHQTVSLAAFRGKVVLLNFWATWCSPCLAEIPHFVEWQRKYAAQGLQVIGISMDDDEQPVRAAYQKYRLNYPVAMGDEQLGEMYGGILGLPVSFLIDRNGQIRFQHRGGIDLELAQSEIQSLLSKR